MIDKLLLNNQIITNKKKIQQARTQTINKLVQKIRKLKLFNEKNPHNPKITKKMEKIPEIMQCLKKLKVVDIVQKTLTFNKKPNAILTNGQAASDDVAIALLACNKILAGVVETLKTVLSLNDRNLGWQKEILEISKRKKRIIGSSGKTKKVTNKKQPKVLAKKLEWKEETLNSCEAKKLDENVDIPLRDEKIIDSAVKPSISKQLAKSKTKNHNKKDLSSENLNEPEEMATEKPLEIVDPFFFTQSGDNYLSSVVIDRIQPEPVLDGLIRRERRGNIITSNKNKNMPRKHFIQKADGFNKGRNTHQTQTTEMGYNFEPKSDLQSKQNTAAQEKLHPSWVAKQKLKPAIIEFKGQKITFDNDGNDTTRKSPMKINDKTRPKNQESSNVSMHENIHPSGAAKQRQKPSITEFKGTKIRFDGNDTTQKSQQKINDKTRSTNQESSTLSMHENIHPSWAAKQRQKPSITEFKGTKIKFDS